ncbi:putative chaperone protein HSP31 [Endogone sp. FLAS-F59071]|nr:putative chaperone protein HSP31 [Endogone sp. FLAS-F59071]|eukprot:RUS19185.1 putative chaperone protein HSP31 [Endogone sp. FLAS-F59071]
MPISTINPLSFPFPLGNKTGFWLPEVAHPYYILKEKYDLVFATPKGGKSPIDPGSIEQSKDDSVSLGFLTDQEAVRFIENTYRIDEFVGRESEFVAVLYPGGHGRVFLEKKKTDMWLRPNGTLCRLGIDYSVSDSLPPGPVFDLYNDEKSHSIAAKIYEQGGVVAALCHGPAAIVNIKLSNGEYLVKGKKVTSFSNKEEEAIRGIVTNGAEWSNNVVVDGRLVTGQNPKSAASTAEAILRVLAH